MNRINLDTNATTPILPTVRDAMLPYWGELGNPSSAHGAGRAARRALDDARERIAAAIHAQPGEITLTSGATEANNIALFGLAGATPGPIVSSEIEHSCVVEPIRILHKRGFPVTWLPATAQGTITTATMLEAITPETRLVTLMAVNHETGANQPVEQVAKALPGSVRLHCDAAQAIGKIPVNVQSLQVATLAATAHKLGGPVGIGLLYVRRDIALSPLAFGGHQEKGLRPGTVPVALAVGFATAVETAVQTMNDTRTKLTTLRSILWKKLNSHTAPVVWNGSPDCYEGTLNVSFPGCRADVLLMALDLAGIYCSTGSACSSGSLLPSPVLKAMGLADDDLRSALRFSYSASLSLDAMEEAAERIVKVVNGVRMGGDR